MKYFSDIFIKHISGAMFILILAMPFSGRALADDVKSGGDTLDEIAAKHQDAILAQKHFKFHSDITRQSDSVDSEKVLTVSGTVDLEGWSHYETEAKDGAAVRYEYFVKDDLPFRFLSIEKKGYTDAADTTEGWEKVESEVFHRDVPLNPLYMFANFLDDKESLTATAKASDDNNCRGLKLSRSVEGDNSEISLCVAENGLATHFFVEKNELAADGGNKKLIMKVKITPLDEAEKIEPPEKVQSLFDDDKKNEEEKENKGKK